MTVLYNISKRRSIRLGQWLSLIFFVCLLAGSCRQKEADITIVWNDRKAIGLSIPKDLLATQTGNVLADLQVRLKGNTTVMLGVYKATDGSILFTPLIPLYPGAAYEVLFKNKLIGEIQVPAANAADVAYLIQVFPTADTLPENLLKIYLQFSAPMQQGQSLQHITLLDNHNDTVPDIFLDLQPELWNTERTELTVWLDPGRIKRDLIPNQEMGNPLQKGKPYTLVISDNWKSALGTPLQKNYTKQFSVGTRDSVSPQPEDWILQMPSAGTIQPLMVQTGEPLDYFLLSETITIADQQGNKIAGHTAVLRKETGVEFIPEKPWLPGHYTIRVATYLEDLAGNNINRLFDRDITTQETGADKNFFERAFLIDK